MSALSQLVANDPFSSDEEDDDFIPDEDEEDEPIDTTDLPSDHEGDKPKKKKQKQPESAEKSEADRRAKVDTLWSELQQAQPSQKRKTRDSPAPIKEVEEQEQPVV
ncbi:hypothetical protein DM01DRAFT_211620 [Hesseltinella vesiculosa]|uniref:Uncharacterized protein n=1 Tax=Hesseltinella vesiculosa TaxID=101127 RepID=A0A1X2GGI6_9FUNG|nr:hypothetical protein DM01DRAFT_211620 [Hesseltinella vesiculosa]